MTLKEKLTNLANMIRSKTGKTGALGFDGMISAISTLGNISKVTAAADDVKAGKVIVDADGYEVTGTLATVEQATPSITVSSGGLIQASATQSQGVVSAGTKSATKQLTTQAAATITPGTSDKTAVASGRYTTGAVIVKGDSNLKAANIKKGVSIFGVSGSLSEGSKIVMGSFTPTSDSSNAITVSGIGFTPKYLHIKLRDPDSVTLSSSYSILKQAWRMSDKSVISGEGSHIPTPPDTDYYGSAISDFCYERVKKSQTFIYYGKDSNFAVTTTADGFTVQGKSTAYYLAAATYDYIAIG